jgi:hypothetical protein
MKKSTALLLSLFFSLLVFESCKKKKDENPAPSGSSSTCLVSQEKYIDVTNTDTTINKYSYNSNNKLVKVATYDTQNNLLSYDTITYSSATTIDSVKSYDLTGPSPVVVTKRKYAYTSGNISSVVEAGTNSKGAYNKTLAYTYNGSNQLTAITTTYNTGTPETGEPTSISGITFTNGNITSATANLNGVGSQNVSASYDVTAPNPYKGLPLDPQDPTSMFNTNNTSNLSIGIVESSSFTYTYSGGNVATIDETDTITGAGSSETKTVISSYHCF